MIFGIVYVVVFLVFISAPLPFQIVFMIANMFIQDPIPVLDEAFMMASILKKFGTAFRIMEFVEEHPKAFRGIIISTAIILLFLIIVLLF